MCVLGTKIQPSEAERTPRPPSRRGVGYTCRSVFRKHNTVLVLLLLAFEFSSPLSSLRDADGSLTLSESLFLHGENEIQISLTRISRGSSESQPGKGL
jgi:hypothetical protein